MVKAARSMLLGLCLVGMWLSSLCAQEPQLRDAPQELEQYEATQAAQIDQLQRALPKSLIPEALTPPNIIRPNAEHGDLEVTADEVLSLPNEVNVPLRKQSLPERAQVSADGNLVTLVVRDASLGLVLGAIAEQMNLNVVSAGDVTGNISITLNRVPLEDALDAILSINGYRWIVRKNIIMVSDLNGEGRLAPNVQGREVRVFKLDFVSAEEIDRNIKGLLSSVGTSFTTVIDSQDKLRTREEILVEDLPEYLARVEAYIAQADQPPRQVLIEAHVLQVALGDTNKHGVDLQDVARIAKADITLKSNGIANAGASPGFFLNIDSNRVNSVIEVIQSTTDAKTLASPKVLAINGQEARIQIGERLGYVTTTTTQTSSLQSVEFLDLGVVLSVTPIIGRNGQILMKVHPEVSSGAINANTGLPDEDTTEVDTTVLLPSGRAMVIGGLIKETDSDQQGKLPIAGDIPVIGKLFQRRERLKDRNEIIIALIPRIVPYDQEADFGHAEEIHRATTPLLYGPLIRVDRRRAEATLPNANGYCERYGKPMDCFPSATVAYSQNGIEATEELPYFPMAPGNGSVIQGTPVEQTVPLQPHHLAPPEPLPRHFLPPANLDGDSGHQAAGERPVIRQTSGRTLNGLLKTAKDEATSGWRKSRSAQR